jgi:hypothetical protein
MSLSNQALGPISISSLDTGDILLFHGNTWYDAILEKLGKSRFSHVGLVLKNPVWLDKNLKDETYLLESGYEDFPDVDGKQPLGVQLVNLAECLSKYPGKVVARQLFCKRDEKFYQTLKDVYNKHKNDSYDTSIFDWIEAKWLLTFGEEETLRCFYWNDPRKQHTFWCSALTAFVYNQLGFLDDCKTLPWTLVSPRDFSTCRGEKLIKFKDCIIGDEVKLK